MNATPPPFDQIWFQYLVGICIGLCCGSFVTMLSYRIPAGLSILAPPSHCPKCKTSLMPQDLVPVLSWVSTKGRCRHCGAKISIRYVLIEILTAALCASAFALFGFELPLIPAILTIIALVTIGTIYIERERP